MAIHIHVNLPYIVAYGVYDKRIKWVALIDIAVTLHPNVQSTFSSKILFVLLSTNGVVHGS